DLYEIPLIYQQQNLDVIVLQKLELPIRELDMERWRQIVYSFVNSNDIIRIGVVGKYIDLHDSYKSVDEALYHGGFANGLKVQLTKIDSEKLEKIKNLDEVFQGLHGILVPGGFGQRGILGMIKAAKWAREHKVPYFGICLGLQIMVIEFARSVLKLEDADSTEFAPSCKNPVVVLMEEQIDVKNYGGTMRLGRWDALLKPGSLVREVYGTDTIHERHRHRYEVSNRYRPLLEEAGLQVVGTTLDGSLVEIMQWDKHPWGIGVQFHPEFQSKPIEAHPLFKSFVKACKEYRDANPQVKVSAQEP
ncbi:MAG: CTP synthase, partial [Spirochaetales bacterium]